MDDATVRRVWAEMPAENRKTPRRVETRSIFLGTLHTVLWLGDVASAGMEELLPAGMSLMDLARDSTAFRLAELLSAHAAFPKQVNVNLAKVRDSRRVELITWERGAGLTDACGTGAAATVWVGYQEGRLKKETKVLLRRGELDIRIEDTGQVFMTGPSVRIMKGSYYGGAGNHPVHQ
jgi:diaminopimelate epimerase